MVQTSTACAPTTRSGEHRSDHGLGLGGDDGLLSRGSLLTGALRDLSDGWALPFLVAGIGTASGLVWLALATRPRLPEEPADIDESETTMSYPQARN